MRIWVKYLRVAVECVLYSFKSHPLHLSPYGRQTKLFSYRNKICLLLIGWIKFHFLFLLKNAVPGPHFSSSFGPTNGPFRPSFLCFLLLFWKYFSLKYCTEIFFIKKSSQKYFWESVWKSVLRSLKKYIRKSFQNSFTQIQHGNRNTSWQHKYKLAIQIKIGKKNTKWQQKYNRTTKMQFKKKYKLVYKNTTWRQKYNLAGGYKRYSNTASISVALWQPSW